MKYGTQKTVYDYGNAVLSDIIKYSEAGVHPERSYRNYRIQVRVADKNEELGEYIKFTEEVDAMKRAQLLMVDPEDNLTWPMFVVKYPKDYNYGPYFIIKCYTLLLAE